jgi:hypothetical protein
MTAKQVRRLVPCGALLFTFCAGQALGWAQSADSSGGQSEANQSWNATSNQRSPSGDFNPIRTVESHKEENGRTVDKQSLERLGSGGHYEPYRDTERESVRVDAATVRTVERTFGRGPDGQKTLVQVREEEIRSLPGGEQKVVRTVSNPDANGRLQVVQRELQETKQPRPDVRKTTNTIFTPDLNGGLAPVMRTEELNTKRNDHEVEFRKSTLLPDSNGGWQVNELREGTITQENAKTRTKDERVSRLDADGKLGVVERTLSKELENAPGETKQTVESYSTEVPGGFGDGKLQLNQRVTTVRHKGTDGGQQTEEQVEQRNPAAPGEPPRVTQKTIDIVRPNGSGEAKETRTIQSLDGNGNLGVVWVDTRKTESAPTVQVDTKNQSNTPAAKVDTKPKQ